MFMAVSYIREKLLRCKEDRRNAHRMVCADHANDPASARRGDLPIAWQMSSPWRLFAARS